MCREAVPVPASLGDVSASPELCRAEWGVVQEWSMVIQEEEERRALTGPCQVLIHHNVFINYFWKVNFPAKLSTQYFN